MADTLLLSRSAPSFPFDTQRQRVDWFNCHGDEIAKARGAFVLALEAYAHVVRQTSAHEGVFSHDNFMSEVLDSADAWLAEEVRDYLGA